MKSLLSFCMTSFCVVHLIVLLVYGMLRKSCKAEQVLLRIRRGREVPPFKKENDEKRDGRRVCLFFGFYL